MSSGASEELSAGALVAGRFRIHSVLGRGATSVVYRATQLSVDREVALKVLKNEAIDAESRARFVLEAKTIARLRSPHSVTIYDSGELDDGGMFIAMELLFGRSLEALLKEGALGPARARKIVLELCESLEEAHALELVHRDIKPSNVFIEESKQGERAKLLDFGLAKRVLDGRAEDLRTLTDPNTICGTPAFMAPEQWHSPELGTIGPWTDIYALGLVAFEMLAGTPCFSASSAAGYMHQHLYVAPPEVAGELQQIIARCLEKQPERRWRSVAELRRAIEGHAHENAPPAPAKPHRGPRLFALSMLAAGACYAWYAIATREAVTPPAVRKIDVVGALSKEQAARSIAAFEPRFAECLRAVSTSSVVLHLVVEPNGSPRTIEARPAIACVETTARELRFAPFSGASFAVVRVEIGPRSTAPE